MAKYHISKNGNPAICKAVGACPLGGDEIHGDSREEIFEKISKQAGGSFGDAVMSSSDVETMGLRELNNAVKTSNSEAVIEKALKDGSERTLQNLSQNKNLTADQVREAYLKASTERTRNALIMNPSFPTEDLHPYQVGEYLSNIRNERVSYQEGFEMRRKFGASAPDDDNYIDEILANVDRTDGFVFKGLASNRNLSEDNIVKIGRHNQQALSEMLKENRFPANEIANLPSENISTNRIVSGELSEEYIDGYADWAIKNEDVNKDLSSRVKNTIANHVDTSAETLDKLARNGANPETVYRNPNTSASTKQFLAENDKSGVVGRLVKIDNIREANGIEHNDDLIKSLVTDRVSTSSRRGYHPTKITLDTEKVAKYGLDSNDIAVLFSANRYNAGFSYNENTGVIEAAIDSSD